MRAFPNSMNNESSLMRYFVTEYESFWYPPACSITVLHYVHRLSVRCFLQSRAVVRLIFDIQVLHIFLFTWPSFKQWELYLVSRKAFRIQLRTIKFVQREKCLPDQDSNPDLQLYVLALYQLSYPDELLGQPRMLFLILFPIVLIRTNLLVSSVFESEHFLGITIFFFWGGGV